MTKRTSTKQAKPLDVGHAHERSQEPDKRAVAQKAIQGRAMVKSGEMLAPAWDRHGQPCDRRLPVAEAKGHRVLCVQDPWTAGIHYMLDREAPLEHGCRVALEMENHDGTVCYLPGRLDTKHPAKAKALQISVMGATGMNYGPCRRCNHADVVRVVSECRAI